MSKIYNQKMTKSRKYILQILRKKYISVCLLVIHFTTFTDTNLVIDRHFRDNGCFLVCIGLTKKLSPKTLVSATSIVIGTQSYFWTRDCSSSGTEWLSLYNSVIKYYVFHFWWSVIAMSWHSLHLAAACKHVRVRLCVHIYVYLGR